MDYPLSKTTPWPHQLDCWEKSKEFPRFYIAHDMGCGKSKAAIDYCNSNNLKRILVLSPKSVVGVWPRQFKIHSNIDYNVFPILKQKTSDTTITKVNRVKNILRDAGPNDYIAIVINYETAWLPGMGPVYDRTTNRVIELGTLLRADFDGLICDEAHRLKSPGGKQSWFTKRLGKKIPFIRMLSGTPMPHSPLDIYAQYRTMDPSIFGTSFAKFRQRYCIMGGYENKQVIKFINMDELNAKFYSRAHYVKSEDVFDLPDQDNNIYCDLSPKALRLYKEFETELVAQIQNRQITAKNGLVKLLRLAQMAGGNASTDDHRVIPIDSSKVDTAADLISDLAPGEPVVVFTWFIPEINLLKKKLEKMGRKVGILSGQHTPPVDFVDSQWRATHTNAMLVQIQAGSEGIDLSVSRYCVYLSTGYSLGKYRQSRRRLNRPSEFHDNTHKVFYYHILANNTVDLKIARGIEKKADLVDYVLGEMNAQGNLSMQGEAVSDALQMFGMGG